MHNSFTLDLNQNRSSLFTAKGTLDKDAETLDSGLATASQFRRYPREQVMQQIQPGSSLRQMRHNRKLLQEEYKRISCRLQFQRNKDQKTLNKAYNQQNRLYDIQYHEEKKKEEEKRIMEIRQRQKFQNWVKGQEVQKIRKTLQTSRRQSVIKQQSRKKKEIDVFKRKFDSQKSYSQKIRRLSLEQTKLKHDSVLKMKQQQKIKKKIHLRKRQELIQEGIIDKIERYGDQTVKTMRLIGQMRQKQQQLQRRNKSYGKILMGILDNFKKLQNL